MREPKRKKYIPIQLTAKQLPGNKTITEYMHLRMQVYRWSARGRVLSKKPSEVCARV